MTDFSLRTRIFATFLVPAEVLVTDSSVIVTMALSGLVFQVWAPGHFLSRICQCTNERRRRENRGAEGAEGVESGEGCPPPQPTRGPGGAS